MRVRRSMERGYADHGWLRSFHTFSFADYYDAAHMGFRALRVINEDRVAPGKGFGTHPHRDMEIISYVLDGALAHRDSMGHGSTMRPGDVQQMSAGTGVLHSEYNASRTDPVHFLQIWILPDRRGHAPGYAQVSIPAEEKRGRLRCVASPDGRDGSLSIHQDALVYAGCFEGPESALVTLSPGRSAWVQVARGRVRINGEGLEAGDGAAFDAAGADGAKLRIDGGEAAEILVFDLA